VGWSKRKRRIADGAHRVACRLGLARPITYVISYPKCGRTWLRLMLGHYLAHHYGLARSEYIRLQEFSRDDPRIPPIRVYHDDKPYKRTPEELTRDKSAYAQDRVVLLVRDPRDVIVSRFYAVKYREQGEPYPGSIGEFLREPRGSLATLCAYYRIWLEQRHVPRAFLVVRYEDMHQDPGKELRRVLELLGVQPIREEGIAAAVEFGRFDNMRRLEQQDAFGVRTLRPSDQADPRSYKTRKGIVGDHRNEIPAEDLAWMDRFVAEHVPAELGYGGDAGRPEG
jgi:hypothetical protein